MARQSELRTDEWIYKQVFSAILEQRLQPGVKLTEDDLCEIFGVSRTTIRRVLLRLSYDKVVDIRPNRGAVIASPTIQEVHEMFAARRILERNIVALACQNCTEDEGRNLRKLVDRERGCFSKGDRPGWIRLSGDFHLEIALLAGNRPLGDFLRQLVVQTSLAIALYEAPGRSVCGGEDHVEIVDALLDKDIARVQGLMDVHLERCEHRLSLKEAAEPGDLRAVFAKVVGLKRRA